MIYHPAHSHWHVQDFCLLRSQAGVDVGPSPGAAVKVSFCVIDTDTSSTVTAGLAGIVDYYGARS